MKRIKKIVDKVKSLLTVRGWKIRPKVWIEREDREDNPGYFPKTKGEKR